MNLQRSQTVVHVRSRSNPDISQTQNMPRFSTIDRHGASSPLQPSSSYSALTPTSIHSLQLAAFKRLNAIFKRHRLRTLDPSNLSAVSNSAVASKRKWWESFFKAKHKLPPSTIMGEFLCKSVEFASLPVDSSEHSFNIRRIPILIHECAKYLRTYGLKTTGVFRVSGSEKRIVDIISEFESAPTYGLGSAFTGKTVHDVASFMKKFLKLLPEPIFSSDLYQYFVSCMELPAPDGSRTYAIRLLMYLLPPPHLILLEYLLALFAEIHENSGENQMNAYNLGLIFAPTLLRNKANKTPVEEYEKLARLLEFMITNLHQFIITHPLRDPEQCLDVIILPALPYVYSESQNKSALNLARPNFKSSIYPVSANSPTADASPLIYQPMERSPVASTPTSPGQDTSFKPLMSQLAPDSGNVITVTRVNRSRDASSPGQSSPVRSPAP